MSSPRQPNKTTMHSPAKAIKNFRAVVAKNLRSRRDSELLAGPELRRSISARTRAKNGRAALSEYQLGKAARRYSLLQAALPLLQKKRSQFSVSAVVGTSAASLSRLLNLAPVSRVERRSNLNAAEKCRRLIAAGREALAPDVAEGRKSPFTPLLRNSDVVSELKRLYVQTLVDGPEPTAGRRPGSIALTLRRLGDFPLMPPRLAVRLQSGCKPKPLVEFLKRTYSPEVGVKLWHYSRRIATGKVRIEVQSNRRPAIWLHDRRLSA